jgi:hypothetical protein
MNPRGRNWRLAHGLFAVLLLLGGCGKKGPATITVSGVVTQGGQPVVGAVVGFVPQDEKGKPAQGTTDAEGRFTLKTYLAPGEEVAGALAGDYQVTVQKFEAVSSAEPAGGGAMRAAKNLLPPRYSAPTTSGLTAQVTPDGTNEFPFALEP